MTMYAETPNPPYYAVIFSSVRAEGGMDYEETAKRMLELAKQQDGFLGVESAREELGITVSYWRSLAAIQNWKNQLEHKMAQQKGKSIWYASFKARIAKVERDYAFIK